MRTTLVTAGVLGLIVMAGISARSDQASAQSRGHADFQGYWMGVDPVDGGDARRSLILRTDGTVPRSRPVTPCFISATARIAALPASMTARSSVEQ